jgi:O-antigen ligase
VAEVDLRENSVLKRNAESLDRIVIIFLLLFVLLQPLSIAGAFIAYSGAALAWIIRLVLARRGVLQPSPLDLPILIYWILCTVSALLSPLPASSWEGMRKVNLLFLAIIVAHNVPTVRRAKVLVGVLFLATLASAAFAGWQLIEGVGLRVVELRSNSVFYRAGIRKGNVILRVDNQLIRKPEEFQTYLRSKAPGESVRLLTVDDLGIDVLKDAVPVDVSALPPAKNHNATDFGMKVEIEHLSRSRGFYSHPVTYAMVLESLACLAFGLWLAFRKHPSRATRYLLLSLWLTLALVLGATLTRSAWMAFACGVLLLVWLELRRPWLKVALPVLLLFAAVGTNAAIRHWRGVGLIDPHDQGSEYRVLMWQDGLRIIRDHPWFGVGMNTVRDTWWKFNLAAYQKYGLRSHFHSTPIQLGVMQGIPVLLAWAGLMGCYWLMLLRLVREARLRGDPFSYGLALGILGATGAFLVSSLVQYNFGDSVVVLQFWLLAGLALALRRQMQTEMQGDRRETLQPGPNGSLR